MIDFYKHHLQCVHFNKITSMAILSIAQEELLTNKSAVYVFANKQDEDFFYQQREKYKEMLLNMKKEREDD